jgi:hypothetical protein
MIELELSDCSLPKCVPDESGKTGEAFAYKEFWGGNDFESLADALIESRCGTHSLGLIYDFLLRMTRDPKAARCEFVNFLSGDWSPRWAEAAAARVAEEQLEWCRTASETMSAANEDDADRRLPLEVLSLPIFADGLSVSP